MSASSSAKQRRSPAMITGSAELEQLFDALCANDGIGKAEAVFACGHIDDRLHDRHCILFFHAERSEDLAGIEKFLLFAGDLRRIGLGGVDGIMADFRRIRKCGSRDIHSPLIIRILGDVEFALFDVGIHLFKILCGRDPGRRVFAVLVCGKLTDSKDLLHG